MALVVVVGEKLAEDVGEPFCFSYESFLWFLIVEMRRKREIG